MIKSASVAVVTILMVQLASLFLLTESAEAKLADLKKPGHFALIRHARAPGTGDPAEFKLGECQTQRNLSPEGLTQAESLGRKLKTSIGDKYFVYSSQWCRCMDTAKALGGRAPEALVSLNSFFQDPRTEKRQTDELKLWLFANLKKRHPLVLVTHQVNITALTGIFPSEAEVIVMKLDESGNVSAISQGN